MMLQPRRRALSTLIAVFGIASCASETGAVSNIVNNETDTTATIAARATPFGPLPVDADVTGALRSDVSIGIYPTVVPPAPSPVPTGLPTPTPTPVPPPTPEPCAEYTLSAAEFMVGSNELTDGASASVAEVARLIRNLPPIASLKIVGHTDSQPYDGPGGNQGLSERRAEAVYQGLLDNGFDPIVPVERVGKSDSMPVAIGETPEALAKNRRVEVFVRC